MQGLVTRSLDPCSLRLLSSLASGSHSATESLSWHAATALTHCASSSLVIICLVFMFSSLK